jgi:hypothetical protein
MRVEVQLPSWLEGVDGWLGEEIAGVLFRSARETARRRPDPCVVEIGSWMGRSTIVIAKGLLDGEANGTVHAIDPHEIPGTRKVAEDRLAQLRANLATAGVEDVVEVVAARSHDARPSSTTRRWTCSSSMATTATRGCGWTSTTGHPR